MSTFPSSAPARRRRATPAEALARPIGTRPMARLGRLVSLTLALGALLGAVSLGGACDGGSAAPEKLCDPGENIFCRCPGGEAGTKTCMPDGQSFAECVGRGGVCQEVGGSGTGATGATGTGATGATGTGATGATGNGGAGAGGAGAGGNVGTEPLYAACTDDGDCQSGLCPQGFCTKECAAYDECMLGKGECVAFDQTTQLCMPNCSSQDDCDPYGSPSACGFAHAVDGLGVTTCGDWLDELAYPPDGSDCTDDVDCSLGHEGSERICLFQQCTAGCREHADCPGALICSGQGGNAGTCY